MAVVTDARSTGVEAGSSQLGADAKEAIFQSWAIPTELKRASRELSRLSQTRSLVALAGVWAVIAAAIGIAVYVDHWLVTVAAILVIAGRQHALGILFHEGTHYRMLRNKTANDLVCDFFCAIPLGVTTEGYRQEHLAHHRGPNSPQDPYWTMFEADEAWHWPKSRIAAAWVMMRDVLGLNIIANARMVLRWSVLRGFVAGDPHISRAGYGEWFRFVLFWSIAIAGVAFANAWREAVLYWFIPLVGPLMLFVRMRVSAEHLMPGAEAAQGENNANHVDGMWWERVFIAPLSINYHVVHHLFPGIPWYNLKSMHRALMEDEMYRSWSRRYASYWGISGGLYPSTLLIARSRARSEV